MWYGKCRKAARDSSEARSNCFDRNAKQSYGEGRTEGDDNRSRNALGKFETENQDSDRNDSERSSRHGDGVPRRAEGFHAMEEVSRDTVHAQAKEVANLSAGDEDGDAVREADNHRTRKILYGCPHPCDAEENEQDAGHHGAFEESVNAMLGDDSGDDDNKSSGGPADLCF